MNKSRSGFTIVELLITIVVIGILAAITVTAYNGIQDRANNTTRLVEMKNWVKQFELYQAYYGKLPDVPKNDHCLGTGFPNGKCKGYASSDSTQFRSETDPSAVTLMNELKKVGELPSGTRTPVNWNIGPYVDYSAYPWGIYVVGIFKNKSGECPGGMAEWWADDNNKTLFCAELVQS